MAAFFYLFSKRERLRYTAMAIMGIGMVFFGLELMKNGFKPIRTMPEFEAWFQRFQADSYLGVLKCALVGCVLTVIVQSSSATLGITIALALTGVLTFETAAALVLGENIGTTITAFLASLGANANARRAAYFHVLFNTIGVSLDHGALSTLPPHHPVDRAGSFRSGGSQRGRVQRGRRAKLPEYDGWHRHRPHGVQRRQRPGVFAFPVYFANLLENRVSDRAKREKRFLTNLDFQMYDSPFAALEQSRAEIGRMSVTTREMLHDLERFAEADPEERDAASRAIFEKEEKLDVVQKEITMFLTDALSGQLSHDLTEESKQQIRLCDEYESE